VPGGAGAGARGRTAPEERGTPQALWDSRKRASVDRRQQEGRGSAPRDPRIKIRAAGRALTPPPDRARAGRSTRPSTAASSQRRAAPPLLPAKAPLRTVQRGD
jgi:hypothetical protein